MVEDKALPITSGCPLSGLPPEIIHHIYNFLDIGDIENFAATNKYIRNAGDFSLRIHRQRIKEYSHFEVVSRLPGLCPHFWTASKHFPLAKMSLTDA